MVDKVMETWTGSAGQYYYIRFSRSGAATHYHYHLLFSSSVVFHPYLGSAARSGAAYDHECVKERVQLYLKRDNVKFTNREFSMLPGLESLRTKR